MSMLSLRESARLDVNSALAITDLVCVPTYSASWTRCLGCFLAAFNFSWLGSILLLHGSAGAHDRLRQFVILENVKNLVQKAMVAAMQYLIEVHRLAFVYCF